MGHRPLPHTVARIAYYQPPRDKKGLLRFLGLVNLYREQIPGFSDIAEPLYRLTRNAASWKWDSAALQAFATLKQYLTESPLLLAYPDWNKPFYLQTDASKVAVGGVLPQNDSNCSLKPIAFFSSGLNPAKRRYAASEIKCWALIDMARKFNDYLKAAGKIYFVTDHNPLCWLRKQHDPRARFSRWIQELEILDYEVLYTKGTENKVADFLSRIESDTDSNVNEEVEHFERMVYHLPSPEPDLAQLIGKEQSKDQGIIFARDQVRRFGRVTKGRYSCQHLTMLDGLLRRNGKILVPDVVNSPKLITS